MCRGKIRFCVSSTLVENGKRQVLCQFHFCRKLMCRGKIRFCVSSTLVESECVEENKASCQFRFGKK